jgi:hypothetical protein
MADMAVGEPVVLRLKKSFITWQLGFYDAKDREQQKGSKG